MSLNFNANCFICDRLIENSLFDEREKELNSFEEHLLYEHDVVIPRFDNYCDFQEYLKSLEHFQDINKDRISTFTMSRFV